MFPDLCTKMKHNVKELPVDQTVILKQLDGADGSFVFYHFMATFLRSGQGIVFLVATGHSQSHYVSVLSKLGVQLSKQVEHGRCDIFDLTLQCSENSEFSFDLRTIKSVIKNRLIRFLEKDNDKKPLLFLIDDVSILLDLTNNDFKDVFQFVQHFRHLVLRARLSTFLIGTCTYANLDLTDSTERMTSSVAHYAQWVLTVKPLTTGWSKDVHGEITLQEIDRLKIHENISTSKLLYRLSDRNVTFMAPGLIPGIGI